MSQRSALKNDLSRYKKLAKKNPLLFSRVADIELKLGQYKSARKRLEEGLRYHPDHSTGRLLLAKAMEKTGSREEAIDELRTLVKQEPMNTRARREFIAALTDSGHTDELRRQMFQLYQIDPEDKQSRKGLRTLILAKVREKHPNIHDWPEEWLLADFTREGALAKRVARDMHLAEERPCPPDDVVPTLEDTDIIDTKDELRRLGEPLDQPADVIPEIHPKTTVEVSQDDLEETMHGELDTPDEWQLDKQETAGTVTTEPVEEIGEEVTETDEDDDTLAALQADMAAMQFDQEQHSDSTATKDETPAADEAATVATFDVEPLPDEPETESDVMTEPAEDSVQEAEMLVDEEVTTVEEPGIPIDDADESLLDEEETDEIEEEVEEEEEEYNPVKEALRAAGLEPKNYVDIKKLLALTEQEEPPLIQKPSIKKAAKRQKPAPTEEKPAEGTDVAPQSVPLPSDTPEKPSDEDVVTAEPVEAVPAEEATSTQPEEQTPQIEIDDLDTSFSQSDIDSMFKEAGITSKEELQQMQQDEHEELEQEESGDTTESGDMDEVLPEEPAPASIPEAKDTESADFNQADLNALFDQKQDDMDGGSFSQDDIDALLKGGASKSEPEPEEDPAPSAGGGSFSQDDINALLKGGASKPESAPEPEPDPEPEEEPAPSSGGGSFSQDDINALLKGGASKPESEPEPEPEPEPEEEPAPSAGGGSFSQDDIDALLKGGASKPEPEPEPEPEEEPAPPSGGGSFSQDDIDALLKGGASKPEPESEPEPEPEEEPAPSAGGGSFSQDDIDALLKGGASKPEPEPEPEEEPAPSAGGGSFSQDDIDALLKGGASKPEPEPEPEEEPAPSSGGGSFSQDDINALLKGGASKPESEPEPEPEEEPAPSSSGGSFSQDDIDALLKGGASKPEPEPEQEPEEELAPPSGGGSFSQDDIDALLKGGASKPEPEPEEEPAPSAGGGSFSQDDIDALLKGGASKPEPETEPEPEEEPAPSAGGGSFSQDDIDALLKGGASKPESEPEEDEMSKAAARTLKELDAHEDFDYETGFSQDDLDELIRAKKEMDRKPVEPPSLGQKGPLGQDDISALFANRSPVKGKEDPVAKEDEQPVEDTPVELPEDKGKPFSQDDISALFNQVKEKGKEAHEELVEESQEDEQPTSVADIMNAEPEKSPTDMATSEAKLEVATDETAPAEEVEEEVTAEAPEVEEVEEEISVPEEKPVSPAKTTLFNQDDINTLLRDMGNIRRSGPKPTVSKTLSQPPVEQEIPEEPVEEVVSADEPVIEEPAAKKHPDGRFDLDQWFHSKQDDQDSGPAPAKPLPKPAKPQAHVGQAGTSARKAVLRGPVTKTFARLLLKQGHSDLASIIAHRLYLLNPEDPEVIDLLAESISGMEEPDVE